MARLQPRTTTVLAWSLWLVAFGCCAGGLVVTLAVIRPLTVAVLAEGAVRALVFPLGFATIGLVLTLRRPANPIGWLFVAAGLAWSLPIPAEPWLDRLVGEQRPLPLLAKVAAVYGEFNWAPATVLGVTCRRCWCPTGGCARAAGGGSRPAPWPRPPWCWRRPPGGCARPAWKAGSSRARWPSWR